MFEQLQEFGLELESTQKATDDDIRFFEQTLGVELGDEYKSFLKEFGTLEVEFYEFYGFFKDNISIPSAIFATKEARKTISNFPQDLVVFYEAGDGSFYCVKSDNSVVVCNYNRCQNIDLNFKEFIFAQIESLKNG